MWPTAKTIEALARIAREFEVTFEVPRAAPAVTPELSPEEAQRRATEFLAVLDKKTTPTEADAPALVPATDHQEKAKARARRNWIKGAVRPAWRKRKRGDLNDDIYPKGGWNRMLGVIDNEVRAAMSRTVLLAYLACCEEADYDGQFEMPAGQLGERIGCNRRNAQDAIYTLLDAKTIKVIHPGGQRTPNVYSLVPAREFDKAHAVQVFELARKAVRAQMAKVDAAVATK